MLKHARVLVAALLLLPGLVLAQGSLQQITVPGPSLEGNLQGNPSERTAFVYLPQGYESSGKRYPVVYFLHGYAVTADVYVNDVLNLPESVDAAMANGAREAIIVMPDAFTRFGGSFYSNSPTIGDWESFIAKDLVGYIDANYRTIATRAGRGLSGHSMGGYGTLRVGMKYPAVFNALYAMSAGALLDNIPSVDDVKVQHERMAAGIETEARSMVNGMQARASAWSPNPQNPPYYFDMPFDAEGNAVPLVAQKWTANTLLVTMDQNVPALQTFKGLMLDVGNEDGLEASNTQFDAALTRLGVAHGYEIYEGNHGNRVGARFIGNVLPFFEQHLQAD
jgi:S-formylglutathione hydrolase FrmB